ncbi:Proprotein convertase P-domain [Mactra antiquata]
MKQRWYDESGCTRNCSQCVSDQCLACESGFAFSEDGGCCSKGCVTDHNGFHLCDIMTGECDYTNCYPGFVGPNCRYCPDEIHLCDVCAERVTTTERIIDCLICAGGYFPTENGTQCCHEGCNSCTGPNNQNCTECRDFYYLYGTVCDTCGDYCQPPTNTAEPRCNPENGECLYGCLDRWHGSKCNVICNETTARRCDVCTYDEPRNNLTCKDCIDGFYGSYCEPCEYTCRVPGNDTNICNQDGYCRYGCEDGYRGYKCNARCDSLPDLGNCLVCERDDMICTECKDGYWGNQCQFSCNENCVRHPTSDVPVCAVDNGKCDYGCIAQYYKDDCSGYCPNCGQDTCNRATGACDTPVCDPGFYGASCNFTCPNNCAPDPGNGLPYCDFNNGACSYGCKDGYWGTFCTNGCSVNCKFSPSKQENGPKCFQENGTCLYECKPGFYRHDCVFACESQCVDNTCNIQEGTCSECSKPNPGYLCPFGRFNILEIEYCIFTNSYTVMVTTKNMVGGAQTLPTGGCSQGNYGTHCNLTCQGGDQCLNGECDRLYGLCNGCPLGYYGDYCSTGCEKCYLGNCSQSSGVCLSGCFNKFYGQFCDRACFGRCQRCDQLIATCAECEAGTFGGDTCNSDCSEHCRSSEDGKIYCDQETGYCREGACLNGYYGSQCKFECSQNCMNNSLGLNECNFTTGECLFGCNIGYYGLRCNEFCSTQCRNRNCGDFYNLCVEGCIDEFWGQNCDIVCDSACLDRTCNDDNGYCTLGCVAGQYGDQCELTCTETCIDGSCDRKSGRCMACDEAIPGYLCRIAECTIGLYGLHCDLPCPSSSCKDNICDRDTGVCLGCVQGLYNDTCQLECNTCRPGTTCQQNDGKCDDGCSDGHFGLYCLQTCESCITCDQQTGLCTSCPAGKYGDLCQNDCSPYCLPVDGAVTCELTLGICDSDFCQSGYWGYNCMSVCNDNCNITTSSGLATCNRDTGRCDSGCIPRYYSDQCDRPCDSYCYDFTCDREDGVCAECYKENPSYLCPDAECVNHYILCAVQILEL